MTESAACFSEASSAFCVFMCRKARGTAMLYREKMEYMLFHCYTCLKPSAMLTGAFPVCEAEH
jgi:hypothetical protein